jgi:D-alanine-D-alanine ligase-like ATP-grasp enzyme
VGQSTDAVHRFDDKWETNELLRANGCDVARSALVELVLPKINLKGHVLARLRSADLSFPLIVKPVRGRGSEGVQRVSDLDALVDTLSVLGTTETVVDGESFRQFGSRFLVEEYLPGEEITVGVFPPGHYRINGRQQHFDRHWSLVPVFRYGHVDGVAPYNGVVAVVNNSRIVPGVEARLPWIGSVRAQCELAARLVDARSAIRIDCRLNVHGSPRLFDLNMKPNMTGAGRPNRNDQDSLLAIGARSLNWDYTELLWNLLHQAYVIRPLQQS